MILVIIDSCSKFIECHVMSTANTENTLTRLRQTFSTHGLPEVIVSDNGPQFTSQMFNEFCEANGISHIKVSPYKPASNGMAERAVQVIKNGLRKNKNNQDSLETRLYRYLLYYNRVPQTTTGVAPCELLMKRIIRSRLELIKPNLAANVQV
jgi:transposase InsO family protein